MQEEPHLGALHGEALHNWCTHAIRLGTLGLRRDTDDLERVKARIMRPGIRNAVFLDLDETLTATNIGPSEHFATNDRTVKQVEYYMRARVPDALRARVKIFLDALTARDDTEWFILTDNIYSMTRCTMRLAFDLDTPPGTILDRTVRAVPGALYTPKNQTIAELLALRDAAGLPQVRVVFADNMQAHRHGVDHLLASFGHDARHICCSDLTDGLSDANVVQMLDYVSSNSER